MDMEGYTFQFLEASLAILLLFFHVNDYPDQACMCQ